MAALTTGVSAGEVLELIATGAAGTRAAISQRTGLSRSTVTERLDVLFRAELIQEGDEARSTGGRPSKTLTINTERHLILAADVGEDHLRVVVTDLTSLVLTEVVGAVPVSAGPQTVIDWIVTQGQRMIADLGREPAELVGVALSVPAPVDYARGEVAVPSVMTGWEGVSIEGMVRRTLDVPVVVENDVNARGFGEYLLAWRDEAEVFYVKAGTGIGSAIISGGRVFRGARGAAGDIGHIRLEPERGPRCRCGSVGCVEAFAAGWSLVDRLRSQGLAVADTRQLMGLVAEGSTEATRLLREAGRALGRAIAYGVNLLNPGLVVVGGSLTVGSSQLLMGIREAVHQGSLPLATSELRIELGRGGEQCGAVGAAHLVIGRTLSADQVNARLKNLT